MTLQELEQYLRGNYDSWVDYDQRVSDASQGLLDGGLGGVSLDDLRMSQDLAHVPGSGSGGEAASNRRTDTMNRAWSTLQKSGQPLYQVIDGQRVYMNTGFGYVDGDYVVSPGKDAPIGSYSVAGQKRSGDGWKDVLSMAATIANPILGAALTGAQGGLEGGSGGYGTLFDVASQISDLRTDNGPGQTFADSQGNPSPRPEIPDQPIDTALGWLEGLLGNMDPGAIKIPIPGLPFPIPGSLTWEELMDMARRAGKSVAEILAEMGGSETPTGQPPTGGTGGQPPTGGAGGQPSVPEEEDPGNWWDFGWDWGGSPSTGNPDDPGPQTPGATPDPQTPGALDDPPPEDPETPGGSTGTPGAGGGGGGSGLALPFLLPVFSRDSEPREDFDLWDYQGPDQSYGYQTPDYGTPVNRPLFDWQRQPGQPIQVAPNVQPRNEFLTPAEKARRRQLEGLLG